MKVRLITSCLLLLLGIGTFLYRGNTDLNQVNSYNNYIALAKEKAEEGLPYVARDYYAQALAINSDDINVHLAYMEQDVLLDDGNYITDLEEIISAFPEEAVGYEKLCAYYSENEMPQQIFTTVSQARANGIESQVLEQYYQDNYYTYNYLLNDYDKILTFLGADTLVCKNGLWGYYRVGSNVFLQPSYEEAQPFVNDQAAVKEDGDCYVINIEGAKIQKPSKAVDSIGTIVEGKTVVSLDGKWDIVGDDLNIPEKLTWDDCSNFSGEVVAVKKDGKWGVLNAEGETVLDVAYDDIKLTDYGMCISNGVIFASKDGYYQMYDSSGNQIGTEQFEDVCMFASSQPAAVKQNGKWGFVKTDGTMFMEAQYKEVKSFSFNVAPYYEGGKWGYIDGYGNVVIEPEFDDCLQFSDYGIAPVKNGDSWGLIQLLVMQQ